MENVLKEMNEKFQNYSQSQNDLLDVIKKILNNPNNDGLKWEAKRNPFEDNTFFYDEWYFDYVDRIGKKYSIQVVEGVVRNGSFVCVSYFDNDTNLIKHCYIPVPLDNTTIELYYDVLKGLE